MSTIMPQSELARKALVHITEQRTLNPKQNVASLLDEAGMRFNLTPLDTAFLERLFQNSPTDGAFVDK
ncbi:MAG: hypothetical protein LBS77_04265 [Desulfovibrio sp.]|jgi:hypothetical protein|nr:hypothetical protein [Desulfovibrio sp.]